MFCPCFLLVLKPESMFLRENDYVLYKLHFVILNHHYLSNTNARGKGGTKCSSNKLVQIYSVAKCSSGAITGQGSGEWGLRNTIL